MPKIMAVLPTLSIFGYWAMIVGTLEVQIVGEPMIIRNLM